MSEEATAPEGGAVPETWLGKTRKLPSVSHRPPVEFHVWFNGEDMFDLTFGVTGTGHSSSTWTNEAGLKMIIEELHAALERKWRR